jgi:hypothetical protein
VANISAGGCSIRRTRVTAAAAIILTALATGTAGCGRSAAVSAPHTVLPSAVGQSATVTEAPTGQAEIYEQVLRRYLGTPAENSFPGRTFKIVYVLNQAYADAADPNGKHKQGEPVTPQTQARLTAALAGMARVVFIANPASVIEAANGCGQVKDGGILITLGTPAGNGSVVRVGINGWVACLGATWLTYVLREQPGAGWRVTGTTGSMAVS